MIAYWPQLWPAIGMDFVLIDHDIKIYNALVNMHPQGTPYRPSGFWQPPKLIFRILQSPLSLSKSPLIYSLRDTFVWFMISEWHKKTSMKTRHKVPCVGCRNLVRIPGIAWGSLVCAVRTLSESLDYPEDPGQCVGCDNLVRIPGFTLRIHSVGYDNLVRIPGLPWGSTVWVMITLSESLDYPEDPLCGLW